MNDRAHVRGAARQVGMPAPAAASLRRRVSLRECPGCPPGGLARVLREGPFDVEACASGEALIEMALRRPPEAVVYVIRPESDSDFAVLRLLRRVLPEVPLVIVACEPSLALQAMVRELRPVYYGVQPLDGDELRTAVADALRARRPSQPS